MKRCGNLMEPIADMDNLRESFLLAAKGKGMNHETIRFREDLESELLHIHTSLLEGSYRFGDYRFFKIYDPKERLICAAPFRERVVFHAMMRICHHVFERFQVSCSYASRKGMGTCKALEKACELSRKYKWYVKLDVCKFFDSIHHECMKRMLERLFKDKLLLTYFDALIDSYEASEGRGLPIGNLTSQYFANHYMALADHYAKEHLRQPAMVRYMDDVVFWGNDKQQLKQQAVDYYRFVEQTLRLKMHPLSLNRTDRGLSFLGYVVRPDRMTLNQRSRSRYRHRLAKLNGWLTEGRITEDEYLTRAQSMLSFVEKADSMPFRKKIAV